MEHTDVEPRLARQYVSSQKQQDLRRQIRVAHVAQFSETSASGVDRTVAGLVAHLQDHEVVSEIWHLDHAHPSISERREGPITVYQLPARGRARSAMLGLPPKTRRFIEQRRTQIDVLHLHSVFIPDNVWVARQSGLPYIVTPNGGYSKAVLKGRNRLLKTAWLWARERRYIGVASLVHAVSPREMRHIESTFGIEHVMSAPNAIELPTAPPSPQERWRRSPMRVVFIGRLAIDHKGLDILLEGYGRQVASGVSPDSELIIAGADFRSGRAELEALASSLLPAEHHVRFPGPVYGKDKEELLRTARVFVHASRWEGLPHAVLEALAMGCPVLITPETNLGELVLDYGAGIVASGRPEAFQEAMNQILRLPSHEYEVMSKAAQRLASDRFGWAQVSERIASAYRSILPQ
jgi:glycosyltransferase involved in cell wall biosynthesis